MDHRLAAGRGRRGILSASVGGGLPVERIVSADSGQICLQLPWNFTGEGTTLEVQTANGATRTTPFTVLEVAPSLLPSPRDASSAWVRHADGVPVDWTRPKPCPAKP